MRTPIEPARSRALQRTAAPLGTRTVRVLCQRLLQPTGRFRRRSVSLAFERTSSGAVLAAQL